MAYASTTIARILGQINRSYFLPAIQRPYVWQPDQIIALFDSLLKGYPISTFLFWEIEPSRREDWDIYKFMENFRQGDVHNEMAETAGRDVTLVLDGQQRLTSLLIGLQGRYTVRPKYVRKNNPNSWVQQSLFIDLMKNPSAESEDKDNAEQEAAELGVSYGLRFFAEQPRNGPSQYWMKLARIMDCTSDDAYDALLDDIVDSLPGTVTRQEQRVLERNLERLYRVIWKDEALSFFTETDQSYDRVLDIFIRANDGGTKLSKSDLLLSMITSKWQGITAREEIYNFVAYLNSGLEGRNDVDKDLIMKACLVLSDLDQVYKVGNFTAKNLAIIEQNWSKIKNALEATFKLVNRFGIDQETLTSGNAILPIAYYLYKTGQGDLSASTVENARNAKSIQLWLIGSLINGVFGGNSDATIGAARNIIRENLQSSNNFPYQALVEGLAQRGRLTEFDENNIDGLLQTTYGKRTCFLALSLLYDTTTWGVTHYHIDHIIPRSMTDRRALMSKNIPEVTIARIQDAVNRLGNLELLRGHENLEKSNQPFESWISSRDDGFLERHLIPNRPDLFDVTRLPDFVAERERLIVRHLQKAFFANKNAPVPQKDSVAASF